MAKKKGSHISSNRQQLLDGLEIVKKHPLFGRLDIHCQICDKNTLGKDICAKTFCNKAHFSSYHCDYYYVNEDCDRSPAEWAHIIAHCMLHICFGHFDADHMPECHYDENGRLHADYNRDLWNMACDIYIEKFLANIKFGDTRVTADDIQRYSAAADELKIYNALVRDHISPASNIFGTAGSFPDMGYKSPAVYTDGDKNEYITEFAYALADSVRTVISNAGSSQITENEDSVMHKAGRWFIDHYPLLGGLAAGFKIIDIRQNAVYRDDISVAAVNVVLGEIYVNKGAGLNFEEWKFVLAHEYLHAGLGHHARCQGRIFELWNAACDFVINSWLIDMHIGQMPSLGLLYDESLKNMSAEEIYDELIKNLRKNSKLESFRGCGKGDIIADGYSGSMGSPTTLDDYCRNALRIGLEYHNSSGRGYIPAGLIEEIRALSVPPVPWDVQLAEWFEINFAPLEKRRSYARPSRRQSSCPDIPRPSLLPADIPEHSRTYGVIIDTSGSMSAEMIGIALGAAASYSAAKEVPFVRVVFCDADAYDIGYVSPEDIAGRVRVEGRGGTVLQPAADLLEEAADFPKNAPILIITDGYIEPDFSVRREHAYLIPEGNRLPFRTYAKVFYFKR